MPYPCRRTPRSRRGNGGPAPTYPPDPLADPKVAGWLRQVARRDGLPGMDPERIEEAMNLRPGRMLEILEGRNE